MSNPEGFLSEVATEVRRDRMYRLWRRYGPWAIGAIVVVVAAGAAWEWRERAAEENSRARMEEYLVAANGDDAAEAAEALTAFAAQAAEDGETGYATLARLLAGARLLEAGDAEAAAEAYRAVASDLEAPAVFRELAGLRAVMAEAEGMEPSDLAERLLPLTRDGQLYRYVAGELRVNALLAAGDLDTVLAESSALLDLPDLSRGMRSRLEAMRQVADEQGGTSGTGAVQ